MINKKERGQFFTTNVNFILEGFEKYVIEKYVIDPFAGNGDLLNWAKCNKAIICDGYDIDDNFIKNKIIFNDSLKNIPNAPFILTNPPYLATNKMNQNDKNKYFTDNIYEDYYMLAIKKIIESNVLEGIIIVPVNFFSAENSNKIRIEFMDQYEIGRIKYFKEQVFDDTTYNVVAFYFRQKLHKNKNDQILEITSYPEKLITKYNVKNKYNYRIAGEDLEPILQCKKELKIKRLTESMIEKGNYNVRCAFNDLNDIKNYNTSLLFKNKLENNIILLICIDGTEDKIRAEDIRKQNVKGLVGKNTSRNMASVLIEGINIKEQELLILLFNTELNNLRSKYNSMFLTNFRDRDRKRISFDFCYKLLNYCYERYI